MRYKKSLGENIFNAFNVLLLLLVTIATLYPFWFILVASVSDPFQLMKEGYLMLLPKGFQVHSYIYVILNKMVITGYRNTIIYVVLGTFLNMVLTCLGAYALSRRGVFGRKAFMIFIIITMFFNGGMIPTYLLIDKLNIINTMWAMIIPGAISTYNLIVMRTTFEGIPESLIEGAKIEGANDFRILWSIVLPTSKAIVAVMLLFYAVGHWNTYFNALIYITDRNLYPIQLVLRDILLSNNTDSMSTGVNEHEAGLAISETIKYATIIVTTLPILVIYPMIQKYFVQGVMIGAIKE